MKHILIFGGTGQIGHEMALDLLRNGASVDVVSRGGRALSTELLDAGAKQIDGEGMSRADVVRQSMQGYDAVCDPTVYDDVEALDLLDASDSFGTAVMISTGSVYTDEAGRSLDTVAETGFPQFTAPLPETTRRLPPGNQSYSFRKVAMENTCIESDVPISILRPCAIYGKLALHPREWWIIKRLLDGRDTLPLAFNGQSKFHTSSTQGIASLARLCIETPGDRILNVADPEILSVSDIALTLAKIMDRPLNLIPFDGPAALPERVGASPWSAEYPLTLDTQAAQDFGWDGGPSYEAAVTPLCDWMLKIAAKGNWKDHFTAFTTYAHDPFDYAAEDAFLAKRVK